MGNQVFDESKIITQAYLPSKFLKQQTGKSSQDEMIKGERALMASEEEGDNELYF